MNADRLLHILRCMDAVVTVDGGDLVIDGITDLTADMLADLRTFKPELIALLLEEAANDAAELFDSEVFTREPDPEALAEDWEERAAIIEADAGLSRRDAEAQAWRLVYCSTCTHATARGCRLKLATPHCEAWHFTPSPR